MPHPAPIASPAITALVAYKAYTEATQGEQAAPIIKANVEWHADIATRAPPARRPRAGQLQALAQRAGGVQGSVNVSGRGRVYGAAVGVSTGAVTGTCRLGGEGER